MHCRALRWQCSQEPITAQHRKGLALNTQYRSVGQDASRFNSIYVTHARAHDLWKDSLVMLLAAFGKAQINDRSLAA